MMVSLYPRITSLLILTIVHLLYQVFNFIINDGQNTFLTSYHFINLRPSYDVIDRESGNSPGTPDIQMKACTSGMLNYSILRVTYYECHTMSVVVNISHVVFRVNRNFKIVSSRCKSV